ASMSFQVGVETLNPSWKLQLGKLVGRTGNLRLPAVICPAEHSELIETRSETQRRCTAHRSSKHAGRPWFSALSHGFQTFSFPKKTALVGTAPPPSRIPWATRCFTDTNSESLPSWWGAVQRYPDHITDELTGAVQ